MKCFSRNHESFNACAACYYIYLFDTIQLEFLNYDGEYVDMLLPATGHGQLGEELPDLGAHVLLTRRLEVLQEAAHIGQNWANL